MTVVQVPPFQSDDRTFLPEARSYQVTFDWKTTSGGLKGQCSPHLGTQMDPPRPLEPRTPHERPSSVQEPRLLDPFSSNIARPPAVMATHTARPSTLPSLPGVKALLSPLPLNGVPFDPWRPDSKPTTSQYRHEPVQYPPPLHPSRHSYQSRSDSQAPQDRRLELPLLETQPLKRHALQHPPISSPTTHYKDASRVRVDSNVARPRQSSTSSYAGHSASSPYTPATFDDRGSPASAYDSMPHAAHTPTSAGYLGVRDYPGEGSFHVYEDGRRIPTHVDGEQVNPQWGLTKANKPRKRLALACLDCREKKIKCEPGVNSCLQCEKAKRPCRRYGDRVEVVAAADHASARSNGMANHSDTTSTDWSSNATNGGSPPANRASDNTSQPERDLRSESVPKRRAREELDNGTPNAKRPKSTSPMIFDGYTQLGATAKSQSPAADVKMFAETSDPYAVDPELTMKLLELYFSQINNGVFNLFPRQAFLDWTSRVQEKCASDRMVLYAMLAMALVFAPRTILTTEARENLGRHFAQNAAKILAGNFGRFSLKVVHTRLLLALHDFANGVRGSASDHCGGALRAIGALQYNTEEGCLVESSSNGEDYGLSYKQVVECRRRSFFCAFMMDRGISIGEGTLCTVDRAEIYLRLPCPDDLYEQGLAESATPFFANGHLGEQDTLLTPNVAVSSMAHLICVTLIWADVITFVHRGVHRASFGHAAAYETFYANTHAALQNWAANLPEHLRYNEANVQRSLDQGNAGDFITMHVFYHYALLSLNRWMRFTLNPDSLTRNICEAHFHAHHLLGIAAAFDAAAKADASTGKTGRTPRYSTPFIGNAIRSAIDVATAGGHDSSLKQTIDACTAGLAILGDLQPYWTTARDKFHQCQTRSYQLHNMIKRPYKATSGCWLGRKWGLEHAVESELDAKDDCIYGVRDEDFYEAIDKMMGKVKHSAPRGNAV